MKKILALLLALGMLFSLAACGEDDYAHGGTETVLKLGDHEVPEELYRYFLLNCMDEMSAGNLTYFTSDDREQRLQELDARVVALLKEYYAVTDLAEKLQIELTDKEEQQAKDAITALREGCESDEDYQNGLAQAYLSEYVAYKLGYNEILYSALYETLAATGKYFKTDNKTVRAFAKENFIFCRQFVIKSDTAGADPEAEAKAEQIHDRLQNGEDPAKVLADFENDDTVVGGYYCFAETEDFDALDEQAVMQMEPGQVSDMRMDGYGYHIVVRLEVDGEYLDEHLTEEVFESYCMHKMTLMLQEIEQSYTVTYVSKKEPEAYK